MPTQPTTWPGERFQRPMVTIFRSILPQTCLALVLAGQWWWWVDILVDMGCTTLFGPPGGGWMMSWNNPLKIPPKWHGDDIEWVVV